MKSESFKAVFKEFGHLQRFIASQSNLKKTFKTRRLKAPRIRFDFVEEVLIPDTYESEGFVNPLILFVIFKIFMFLAHLYNHLVSLRRHFQFDVFLTSKVSLWRWREAEGWSGGRTDIP